MAQTPLLQIKNLKTHFQTEHGELTAVDGVSFHISKGETLGIVGESGCGKSVTAQSIMRLLDEKRMTRYEGEVKFKSQNLLSLSNTKMNKIRGNNISMIFQDPLTSLNPVHTIGKQISEAILLHQGVSKRSAYNLSLDMLKLIGIPAPEQRIHKYPHELSGGMQQRIVIAIALSCKPELLIADEPTTALDVTIQAQILNLIKEFKKESNMGMILITHDLGVVAETCNRVAVMYLGKIVEIADVKTLFKNPKHPYTKGLIKSIPKLDQKHKQPLHVIKGSVPSLREIPRGCRFATRCPHATKICQNEEPSLETKSDGNEVRCWHADKILKEEV